MISKELMKKTILPMLLLAAWAWITYHFYVSLEQTEVWKIWMVVGMPFGIHRMCIWLLPKNFDIGGTVGVWSINIIVGCLIGEVVVVWYILRAVYVLVKYFVNLFKISRELSEIFIGAPSHWLAYHKLIQCTL